VRLLVVPFSVPLLTTTLGPGVCPVLRVFVPVKKTVALPPDKVIVPLL
jgi:hypothetical protein